jgi:hypothetical protein
LQGDVNSPGLRLGWISYWTNRVRAEQPLVLVLFIWMLCCLGFVVYIHRFQTPLPYSDEWRLTDIATGKQPLTLRWLWIPVNQHRAPLTRLEVVLLGWANGWDFRLAHYINMALAAIASLILVFAVRAARGYTHFHDAFVCLLVLTPAHFETLMAYAYGYAMALSCFCVAVAALLTGWPLRSFWCLGVYYALAMVVTLSGGPAGNLWALGLCGLVFRAWGESLPRRRLWCVVAGAALVAAASIFMLAKIPDCPQHDHIRSDSLRTTLIATGKEVVGWMGHPILEKLYPWVWFGMGIPLAYLFIRGSIAFWRECKGGKSLKQAAIAWLDLYPLFLATLGVALMIGYGRGRYWSLWDSRLSTLVIPIALVMYLLLVRLRAASLITALLFLWMGLCYGWNWPFAIEWAHNRSKYAGGLPRELQQGKQSLSELTEKYAPALYFSDNPGFLLTQLLEFRQNNLCVFRPHQQREPIAGMGRSLVWKAETGTLSGGLEKLRDPRASEETAVGPSSDASTGGMAAYAFEVPADGCYQLCMRLRNDSSDNELSLQLDAEPSVSWSVPINPDYQACQVKPWLELRAGKHNLAITMPNAPVRLDLLEIVPKYKGLP